MGQDDLYNFLALDPKYRANSPIYPPYENIHFIWTQVILQTMWIVFPHHPLLLEVWMENSMNFHGLETIIWSLRVIYTIHGKKWALGRSRLITWPSSPVCPHHSVWSEIWQYIYSKFNSELNGKNIWNQLETVSSLGTGKQSYILLRLAITPYCPWLH